MLAGVNGTDPFMLREPFLRELKAMGFAGIQNFPTVGLIDGVFRLNLEETGMSYALEVECIGAARELDLLTTPYVFNADEARAMTEAGADIIVAHMGLTTGGAIGARTAKSLEMCGAGGAGDHRRLEDGRRRGAGALSRGPDLEPGRCPVHAGSVFRPGRVLRSQFAGAAADGEGVDGGSHQIRKPDARSAPQGRRTRRDGGVRARIGRGTVMSTIAVLGTFDTKGLEHAFAAQCIRDRGHSVLMMDAGGLGHPQCSTDIGADAIAAEGGVNLAALRARGDRGAMVEAMAGAAAVTLSRLAAERRIHGVLSLGGSGGTAIGTAAMRALPLGLPKVMVSTVASGNVAPYVREKDIVMVPSIVDVAGLNGFARAVFRRAAWAICAMVEAAAVTESAAKPLVVASMFGNTTGCVERARQRLESEGYEVLVFHATGAGGRAMEALIESGAVAGVLDVTTTEWADELVGGVLTAGPARLEGAAVHGVPAIVAPGCLDMVNFGAPDTIPAEFAGRTFYRHNPQVTLMRTTARGVRRTGTDRGGEGQPLHGAGHRADSAACHQRRQ